MSKAIFAAATAVTGWGIFKNLTQELALGGTGTMAMNSYYLLGAALFIAAVAAQQIWPTSK